MDNWDSDITPGARALPTLFPQPLPGLIKPDNRSRGHKKHVRDWFQDTFSTSSDSEAIDVFSSDEDFVNRFKERNRKQFPSPENSSRNSKSPFAPKGRQVNQRRRFSGNKTDSSSDDDDDDFISLFGNVAMQGGGRHRRNRKSTWCTDIEGNVRVAEICYYSVTGTCRYEYRGCYRLHAHQHYYWQVSNEDRHWYNLPLSWVNALEGKYTDPAQEQVSLPKIDEGACEGKIKRLLTLKRAQHWTASFQSMELVSSDRSRTYKLRRLCTEKIQGQGIESSNFTWYFLDKNSKWVEYGRADTSGNQCMMSSITSSQIESHFLLNPNSSMTFTASKFTYILDTRRMIQTNKRTRVVREVRRRPATNKESSETPNYFSFGMTKMRNYTNLPSFWDAMQPKQRSCRVPLSSHSAEYKKVVGVLNGEISSSSISKVERIQNPCLWRAFQNKVDDMTLMYGDAASVKKRQLFHGTQGNVVDNIINENFDWRLHGTSRGQVHGQGTYFSTKASKSYGYCKADPQGNKYLFIALVAVGTITTGDSTMTRPPINPETNSPYDSTGSGSIIVKYDKQEYYPEYILTLNG